MSMFQATGRSILVIGGLGGLGRGISSSFLHAGAHVIALDTHVENEASFRKELKSSTSQLSVICGDATQSEVYATAQEVAKSRGHTVDTIVISATPPQFTNAIEDYDWDYHQQMIDVFLKIPYVATNALVSSMKTAKFGRIINITSEVFETSEPFSSAYVAGKGAQIGWTRSMAAELAPFGITVNLVAPGFIPVERQRPASRSPRWLPENCPRGQMGYSRRYRCCVCLFCFQRSRVYLGTNTFSKRGTNSTLKTVLL